MPLLSLIRSLSRRRLQVDTDTDINTNTNNTQGPDLKLCSACERNTSIPTDLADGILLPPPTNDTHRRASRRVHARHISFDATTEAHQHFKALGYPRIPTYSVEEPRKAHVPRPAYWSRTYHVMYEGVEGPIIQDAMYMSLMQVLLPAPAQTPYIPPEAPVLPSIESFATIKHHVINDDFSLETFTPTPSPPSTPTSQRPHASALATPKGKALFLPSPLADSPSSKRSPQRREVDDTPTKKSPTFKRVAESISMQAVLGLSLSVSSSFDSTANFALGVLVASDSTGKDSGKGWDSIRDLSARMEERRRAQTATF